MLGLEEPSAPPFTPQASTARGGPTTPLSVHSHSSYGPDSASGFDPRRTSFPASSYRSSAVLETGSAIPLQFASHDEPREIQIQRARDSIVGMSSVLSDMKSQLTSVRRASSSSEPAPRAPSDAPQISPGAASRAARIKALGAPWMPSATQEPLGHGVPSRGPPPAFKAPLSPLSPPERIPHSRGQQGSPLDNDSYATAEEQVSDDDADRVVPTMPRLASANWRDMLSPSPTRDLATNPRQSLRQAALASDNDDGDDDEIEVDNDYDENLDASVQTNRGSVPRNQPRADRSTSTPDHSRRASPTAEEIDTMPEICSVDEAVKVRRVRQVPTMHEASTAAPQEAELRVVAPAARGPAARGPAASAAATAASGLAVEDSGAPPVPARHDQRSTGRGHHYHSLSWEEDQSPAHHSRARSDPRAGPAAVHSRTSSARPSQPHAGQPRPHSQPPFSPPTSQPHQGAHSHSRTQSRTQSRTHTRSSSHAAPRADSASRSHSHSQAKPHSAQPDAEQAQRKRNFTKKSIADLVETAPPNHAYDLDEIDLPGPERRLLEKFVNSLSKLSIEIQMDEGKREEGRRRLNNALRALEGWI